MNAGSPSCPARRRLLQALCVYAAGARLPVCASDTSPRLTLGIMPFNSALALMRTHQPLRRHLQQTLGVAVDIQTSPDYVTFLNDSLAGRFDILITGPHFGVIGMERGLTALVRYRAPLQPLLVVRSDSPIHQLQDLRGRRIGLSSRLSISSIGGVRWLQDHGLNFPGDYQLFERATHGAAIASVAVGDLDAAFTTHTPLKQVPEDVRQRVRVLPFDIRIPHLMTLVHPRIDRRMQERIRQALLLFEHHPDGQSFFQETGYQGYEPVSAGDIRTLKPYVDLTRHMMGLAQ